jgi:hypothetical protein
MADTQVQREAEHWVRCEWLKKEFGQSFSKEKLRLTGGGEFEFDAVSADETIAMTISTSSGTTSGGKKPAGKLNKLRSDMLFLLMSSAQRRIVVLTDQSMHAELLKEKARGRVPPNIEFVLASLPAELSSRLAAAQKVAAEEVGG